VSRLQPVLVVTRFRADAQLITEQMRAFSATVVTHWAATGEAALAKAAAHTPRLVFVEHPVEGSAGLAFVRKLRRSDLGCREAPVIVLTSQPTLGAMREAQNAGAHEFLVRPFNALQFAKRLEVVIAPRPWIETAVYVGPDRRRFNSAGGLAGPDRRRGAGRQAKASSAA
jgi:CheY-like chemotaxis protein